MAQIWKEKFNPEIHRDYMLGYQDAGGLPLQSPKDNLIESWIYFARAGRYELQFASKEDLDIAIDYFSRKIHPKSKGLCQNDKCSGQCPLGHTVSYAIAKHRQLLSSKRARE